MFVERLMLLFVGALAGLIGYSLIPGWTIAVTAVGVVITAWISIVRYNHRRNQPTLRH